MLRRGGTDPMGARTKTKRGLGNCAGAKTSEHGIKRGMGHGRRRGFGRCFGRSLSIDQTSPDTKKDLLCEQKNILQEQPNVIDQ
ncbi:DUF5320 domain-containing protein [Peptoniphilus sp. SGI.035]|uniref:DUF5320 domain-containing protein n=1 Tax=Peptoniphilus sp. SGI.035 TaxID=3420564 RepID=UPI003D0368F7